MYKMKSDINFSLTHEILENAENERIHTSYAQEKAILECVSNGDIHALENTYYSLPTTVYGKMTSSNSKLKLLFYASIANTTLVTRYAIEGGLNEETAFSLSDVYIRKMEQCTDVDALMKLNEQMAIEFTLRVAEAKKTRTGAPLPTTLPLVVPARRAPVSNTSITFPSASLKINVSPASEIPSATKLPFCFSVRFVA